jgi:hypothetical protein
LRAPTPNIGRKAAAQADALCQAIDPDSLPLPLDLSLMTYEEAAEVDAVWLQSARRVHPSHEGASRRPCEPGGPSSQRTSAFGGSVARFDPVTDGTERSVAAAT